jgi:hypothetical protein
VVQSFVKQLGQTPLPGSTKSIYHVTTAVFAAAVDDRGIAQSPCRKVRLPKDDSGEVIPPTVKQVHALADADCGRCLGQAGSAPARHARR